ncbi:hypothetical protein phiCTP1_gp13 [Clostridium phage phiCTP1]|uniref:hypothetical protein n=1 Tax=Clostridium phage phiCTP1 TaxID=871584 RepID=UPI0001E0781B|nr:hypothetical protein phiCTP1_gp13 [Clostridium phage phiCTP1]ADL40314.1 hypothetical phage protein [Clostridium phage phiCTP1]
MADAKTTTTATKATKKKVTEVVARKYIKVDGSYRARGEVFEMKNEDFIADLEKRELVSRIK